VLKEDNLALEELVVVGYGVQKKKDLTGSVASVKTEDLGKVAGANALQAMQAKVPGVDLQQSDGQAGAGVSIKLRGNRSILASNNPLILVDGVEYGSNLDIPASEIESMDILKDAASTAIYGTKGANGVIIITTKRGQSGKTRVGFNAYLSFNSPTNVVKPMYGDKEVQRLVDAKNYQEAASNNWDFSKGTATAESILGGAVHSYSGLNLYNDIVKNGSYTDWFDLILQNSVSQNYEVNVSGGTDKTNFNVAMSMMDAEGIMKNDIFKRYTGRVNIDHKINKIVKIGTSLSYTYRDNDRRNGSVYGLAQKMTTIAHPYDADGNIIPKPSYFYDAHGNPLLDEVEGAFQHNIETSRFFGSAYVQLTPIKDLIIKSNLTLDRSAQRDGTYNDMNSVGRFQSPTTSYISLFNNYSTKYVWQNTANYNFNIGADHDLTALLGHEMTQTVKETNGTEGDAGAEHYYKGAFYDVSKIISPKVTSSYVKTSMMSYFARLNYTYLGRYLFQASVRADGSSVLADGHKWGYFPSVSAGWRITEESFMESTKSWLDNLKLRLSWGLSGNAAIEAYQTLATISAIVPNSTNKAPMTLANTDLTWEKTSAFNIGLDFGFLNGRIGGSIDYYITKTYDLLYYLTAPASSVYTSTLGNVGETKGNGLEIAINGSPIRTKEFSWDINASATFSHDEVSKLRDGVNEVIGDQNDILKIGEPVSAFYQYEAQNCWGIGEFDKYVNDNYTSKGKEFTKPYEEYGNPGTLRVVDQNADGVIDDQDKIIYNRSPKAILGMTNTFSYKNFSLSVQMMARLGGYMNYGGYGLYTYDNSNWGDLSYWTPNNTDTKIPSPGTSSKAGGEYQTAVRMVEADYFKIKDITLSYTFDKALLKNIFIQNAKVYCSLKNFITTGKISGYDSERGGSVNFPLSKQVVVGLNVTF
ncbi:MAG: TonB-dependent receptor, partial [Prevotella sp.]|nr:TonB-dependent receptor [Prevotella sp.]